MNRSFTRFFPSDGYLYFFKIFLFHLVIFFLFRILFILRFLPQFSNIPFSAILPSFFFGLKTDSNIVAYLIAPFFLLGLLPYIGVAKNPVSRLVFTSSIGVLFTIIFCLMFSNLFFFQEYNSHLNFTAIEYIKDIKLIVSTIWERYPIVLFLILFLLVGFAYFFSLFKIVAFRQTTKRHFSTHFFYFPLFALVLFYFIRGSFGVSQINWGSSFFSPYNIVNQAALNPVYNLVRDVYYTSSIKSSSLREKITKFENFSDAMKTVQNRVLKKENVLLDEEYPLFQKTQATDRQRHYNVVIIMLEEFTGEFVGALGSNLNLTPHFDKLAENGALFTNFFSNGQRTSKGISATLLSYPPLAGRSLMVQTKGQQKIVSIASVLQENGYHTSFLYGGDIEFDNMRGFFVDKGISEFVSEKDFPKADKLNKWGVADSLVFDKLLDVFKKNRGRAFFSIMLSLTNHPPYTLPQMDKEYSKLTDIEKNYKTFQYVDRQLGIFFEKAQKEPDFDSTIFVILGDHSKTLHHDLSFDYRKSFVPCLFYAPSIVKPAMYDKTTSQMDVAPTILNILQLTYEHNFWGGDMFLEKSEEDFAMIVRNQRFGFVQDGFYLTGEFSAQTNLYKMWEFPIKDYSTEFQREKQEMLNKFYAISQVAYTLYQDKKIAK